MHKRDWLRDKGSSPQSYRNSGEELSENLGLLNLKLLIFYNMTLPMKKLTQRS